MTFFDAVPLVSVGVSLVAIAISGLAYINAVRTRQLQEAQYDASRSARLRLSRFAFWAASMYPATPQDRSATVHFDIKNIGPVHAHEIDIRLDRAGIRRFHGEVYGLPPLASKEITLDIGVVEENTEETLVMTVLYRDHRPHEAVITLHHQGFSRHGVSSGIGLDVIAATLDGRPHPDIDLTADELAARFRP
jgi:selenocysteine lyase/cysteine desulfurase